jgi:hypothetical protein
LERRERKQSQPLIRNPAERRPSSLEVITLDERLAAAARKEGFVLIEVPSVHGRCQ